MQLKTSVRPFVIDVHFAVGQKGE